MNSSKTWPAVCKSLDILSQFAALLSLGLLLSGAATTAGPGFEKFTEIKDVELPELSGLAASRRWPGVYWAHNDSGGTPTIYAFNRRGQVIARVQVDGADATDWEDIALYEQDGQSWLAIADIGDNLAWRSSVTVYLLPEPALDASRAAVQRRIDFRYPDGPRDAEGLAVDAAAGRLLIAEKGGAPVGFYSLPLQPPEGVATAERIADLVLAVPGPLPPASPLSSSRFRISVTAMDLSRDGRQLAMISYGRLFAFTRAEGEDWPTVLARPPRIWRLPKVGGLEALAIEPDGLSVVVAPEGAPVPVFRARRILAP